MGLKSLVFETWADFGTNAIIEWFIALEAALSEKNHALQHINPAPLHPALNFFFLKCKNIIDQKCAGDQQYKEKRIKSLDQFKSKTSLLNRKTKGTDSRDQQNQREQAPLNKHQSHKAKQTSIQWKHRLGDPKTSSKTPSNPADGTTAAETRSKTSTTDPSSSLF